MKVIIGNDHGAVELKERLVAYLKKQSIEVVNRGVDTSDSVDYPDIAEDVTKEFLDGRYDFGILCCGTGIGISMAANKVAGIRAALPQNSFAARMTKEHNNANFICFGGRVEYGETPEAILQAYMDAQFQGGRHQRRIDKLSALDSKR